jgi:uncharacterized Ntn-hydrolase superfamily protein
MRTLFTLLALFVIILSTYSQDTFSIVAVDSVTGEIGSAGASCIDDNAISGGAIIISDILPGRGAIHTQAYWRPANQQNAHNLMEEGFSPIEIIDWLEENDDQGNPTIRQYGVVDFDEDGSPRAAAFTGNNCSYWAGDTAGMYFAIQGNILLGEQIIDSMLSRFLNTEGMLAERLMASLQGANVPGADTRCSGEGVSSLSAFIRVAQPGDTLGEFYLDLNVPETPYGVEPIDSLQVLFDEWLNILDIEEKTGEKYGFNIFPNPADELITISLVGNVESQNFMVTLLDIAGKEAAEPIYFNQKTTIKTSNLSSGIYILTIDDSQKTIHKEKIIIN